MKSKITLLFIFLISIFGYSQDKTYDLLKERTETKILHDRVFDLSKAATIDSKPIDANTFNQFYHEIQRADFLQRLPKYEVLKNEANFGKATKQIPLAILITEYETLKRTSIDNGDVFLQNNQYNVKPNATGLFEKHTISLVSPLLSKSNSNTFLLKDDFILNSTIKKILSVELKLEDSKWVKINFNKPFQLNFKETDKQIVDYKIEFTDGSKVQNSFEFEIISIENIQGKNNEAQAPNIVLPITSTIAYQGYNETAPYFGQGEYELFMDTTNGVLDKPIFLVDGFDPGDSRNSTIIYQSLNYGTGQNLATDLRAQGFDIIILNFPVYTRTGTTTVVDGGVDYIQRNAMILVELINQINAQKVGNEQNVVIGPSMGGLISRYALRYMEMNNLTHQTRLYISFDSPHLGANVPIGFQHLFNYMAYGPLGSTAVQPVVDGLIKSPAAKQMLIDHFEGHLQSGSVFEFNTASNSLLPTGAPNFRNAFQTELNTMGFPVNTRNVSISNGAGNGTMNYAPNFEAMNHTFNVTSSQRAIINLRFTPAANQTNEVSRFRGQQYFLFFWITGYESAANSKSPTYTDGLDSAPGGRFDMAGFQAGAGTDPLLTEFFDNLLVDYFCFIPAWSSMAVSNSTNLYAPINSSSTTPFAASSIPTVNENHVTLNAQNTAFALTEILNPVLANNENLALNSFWIQNPIQNSLQINSNYTIENASIVVKDILGKTIVEMKNQTINGLLEIPISLSNGVYLVTLKNSQGSVTKKIIKG
ncbi:T9SS type A sorting domain-containing protein [Flavobacterium chungnamense]|uniref:Secretion system C-terminal sorting domain-containing protein n=1 Tax=Flavobacterium chungnamense TaxID=706182 RepID=A0ABP7UQW3_9FLAO